jgi:hypothetical protein
MFMKDSIFWDTEPHSSVKVDRRFGGRCRCHLFAACSMLIYFLALKIEEKCSTETSVAFQQTTRCYISEDRGP